MYKDNGINKEQVTSNLKDELNLTKGKLLTTNISFRFFDSVIRNFRSNIIQKKDKHSKYLIPLACLKSTTATTKIKMNKRNKNKSGTIMKKEIKTQVIAYYGKVVKL